ncbi:MAG: alpha/beta hydrolase [Polyangiaceae bacterium]|nr:alpha/beta hydrolase [Polyangiaceae bacterium]
MQRPMLRSLRLMLLAWVATVWGRLRGRPRHPRWPFVFELMVRFLRRDWDESAAWPFERLRAEVDGRPYPRDFAKRVRLEPTTLGGVPVTRFVPEGAQRGKLLVFFHGGSYIYGSAKTTHAELIARLAFESGLEAVGVDYRLAPEHPYPAQLQDALAVFEACVAAGTPEDAIVVAGDSAGGNLALELQLALRDRGRPQARAAVLISPWSDLEMPGASFQDNEPLDYGTREVLLRQAKAFAGDLPLSDARLSLVHARLEGLTPTLVTVGEAEIPRDDILALAARLEQAGVATTLHRARDMPHNAPVFAAYHPEGKAALDAIVAFLKAQLRSAA